jgi:putative ABC transport system permease protein
MDIAPIVSSLRRHRVAAALIVAEIALACAVLCNAFFLIASRFELMRIDSGVDEASLGILRVRGCGDCDSAELGARMLASLRQIPGVESVSVVNAVPFGPRGGDAGLTLAPGGEGASAVAHFYAIGPGAADAMKLPLEAGGTFQSGDFQDTTSYLPADSRVWITRSLAEHLWPGQDPLGKEFWLDTMHFRVLGVLSHLARPNPGRRGADTAEWSVVVPVSERSLFGTFLMRADPRDLPGVLARSRDVAAEVAPDLVVDEDASRPLAELRHRFYRQDRAMSAMLAAVVAALLLVTALGIMGLASFWVQQRTRQIGIRRALGATRGQIQRYFQLENLLLATTGIAIGMALAYGGNRLLMQHYEIARLPAYYLPIGAVLLGLVGQASVLPPARRAAAVPPALATRSA